MEDKKETKVAEEAKTPEKKSPKRYLKYVAIGLAVLMIAEVIILMIK